jgi:hypothetical protein
MMPMAKFVKTLTRQQARVVYTNNSGQQSKSMGWVCYVCLSGVFVILTDRCHHRYICVSSEGFYVPVDFKGSPIFETEVQLALWLFSRVLLLCTKHRHKTHTQKYTHNALTMYSQSTFKAYKSLTRHTHAIAL